MVLTWLSLVFMLLLLLFVIILGPRKLILEYGKNWVSNSFNIKYFFVFVVVVNADATVIVVDYLKRLVKIESIIAEILL